MAENLFQSSYHAFSVYRFEKILKSVYGKCPGSIVPVCRQINDFYFPIYFSEGFSRLDSIHALHVDIQKYRVIRSVIL